MTTKDKLRIAGGIGIVGLAAILAFGSDRLSPPNPPDSPETVEALLTGSVETEKCHPSYSGCLDPTASDYDCAGGSGNGPYYTGRVRVIGPDVFGLDRDRDGWGCE